MNDFRAELEALINKHSMENGSNTPDFILADFLRGTLANFDLAVKARERWYGRDPGALAKEPVQTAEGDIQIPRAPKLATGLNIGTELLKMFGLSGKLVESFKLTVKANDFVRVEAMHYVEMPEKMTQIDLLDYRMVPEAEWRRISKAAENWAWYTDENPDAEGAPR